MHHSRQDKAQSHQNFYKGSSDSTSSASAKGSSNSASSAGARGSSNSTGSASTHSTSAHSASTPDAVRKQNPAYQKARRIIAWIAIILLVGVYIAALIAAITSSPSSSGLFRLCIGLTIAVPVAAWILIYAIGYFTGKHSIASVDLLNSNKAARQEMEDAIAREAAAKEKHSAN